MSLIEGIVSPLARLIDKIIPEYFQSCKLIGIPPLFDSVEMTATTNKAAEVLSLAAHD